MYDFLDRQAAPLRDEDWQQIDTLVVEVARRQLVGRRIIPVFGPLGAGAQDVDYDVFTGTDEAVVSTLGESTDPVRARRRVHEHLPMIYKDFLLYWRDIESSRMLGTPIDLGAAAAAASFCAQKEDDLIFNGNDELGYPGLTTVEGRQTIKAGDWDVPGTAFNDIVQATRNLLAEGFFGPYAVVLNPVAFSQMQRVYANSGVLEINHVREIATGGVFQTPILRDKIGLVVSLGIQNFDIAIGQDLITAYLGPEKMNHPFRVMESLVLRIKRPGAVCTIEGSAPRPPRKK
ncbi:MAG: family 1 encapsulin nanocompartment shell protein [Candidatus Sericytochromatia bacterium]